MARKLADSTKGWGIFSEGNQGRVWNWWNFECDIKRYKSIWEAQVASDIFAIESLELQEAFSMNWVTLFFQECWVMPCRSRRINRWNYLQELRQVFVIPHLTCNLFFLLLLLLFLNQFHTWKLATAGFEPGSDWHCTVSTSIQKKGSLWRLQIAPMSSLALVCSLKDMTHTWARLVWTGIWALPQGSSKWELCSQTWKNSSGLWEFLLWLKHGFEFLNETLGITQRWTFEFSCPSRFLCQLQVHL